MRQTRKRYARQSKIAAAQVVLSGDTTARGLSEELQIKDLTLRRWAQEYETMGNDAFPGSGSPRTNKDHEVVRPGRKVEDLERESKPLGNFQASSSRGGVRGIGSSRSTGAGSAPSGRPERR